MALDSSPRRALLPLLFATATFGSLVSFPALAACQTGQAAKTTLLPDDAARTLATQTVTACLKKAGIEIDEETADLSRHAPPSELYDVTRIVDGDTIWIRRNEKEEKLRLLSVDTEEKLGVDVSPTKPGTVFGEECALWAQRFFIGMGSEAEPPKIGLAFPEGREARDIYGRLLCNVVLADGTDFNVLLVRLGKSPYFNKYGNSMICHEAFVSAQIEARAADRGIWNEKTNTPATGNTPAAKRPYPELLSWWQARATAIEKFRQRHEKEPLAVIASDNPDDLEAAMKHGEAVEVFGTIDRIFDEDDGGVTFLLRSGDKRRALRVVVPKAQIAALTEKIDLRHQNREFRQNYIYVSGIVKRGKRSFEMEGGTAEQWRVAEPAVAKLQPASSD